MWNIYFALAITIIVLGALIARMKYLDNYGSETKRDLSEATWSFIINVMVVICLVINKDYFTTNTSVVFLIIISIEVIWLFKVTASLVNSILSYNFLKYSVMLPSTREAVKLLTKEGHKIENRTRYLIESEGIYFWIIDDKYVISLSGTLLYHSPEDYNTVEVGEVIEIGYLRYKLEVDAVKELFLTEQEFNGREELSY